MAIDTEYISEKDFNSKFKNYFRDMYVFQFKNKEVDFYNKGSFSKARMIAISILSFISDYDLNELSQLRMKDIEFEDESVSICINGCIEANKCINYVLEKPLCEMFKYLRTTNNLAFFLTGNTGTPNLEKLKLEYENFIKNCGYPKTVEKMYRYWGQIYIEEANETVKAGTYRNDSMRIQALVNKMAGVTWKYGQEPDYKTNSLTENDNSSVECITVDARTLKENPFHSLYNYCNRHSSDSEDSRGEHFSLIYSLVLYFNLGVNISKNESSKLEEDELNLLIECLQLIAVALEGEERRHSGSGSWDDFSDEDKELYAYKAIDVFMSSKGYAKKYVDRDLNLTDIYLYLIENKKTIIYSKETFFIKDNTNDTLELDILYDFYSNLVQQTYCIQRRQFSNVIKSLVKNDLFIERKELVLNYNRKKNYTENFNKQVEELLSNSKYQGCELIENVKNRSYCIRYSNRVNDASIKDIKKEIEEACKGWEVKSNKKTYYKLSPMILSEFFNENNDLEQRFSNMISFFSQVLPLGEIGTFINKHTLASDNKFYYKHNYIIRALNDYNLINLLNAIKNEKWIDIECRDAINKHQYQRFVCYPIEVRENASIGTQLLIYYHPAYRSIASVRLDSIDGIRVGEYPKRYYFDEDIRRAKRLIEFTWGEGFDAFFEGNVKADVKPSKVKLVIAFDDKNESFIRNRLKKELPNGSYTEKNQDKNLIYAEIVVNIINPNDMLQWIRSYTTRIVSVEVQYNGFVDDIMRNYKTYQVPSKKTISSSISGTPKAIIESFSKDFTENDNLSEELFNEFYCVSFYKLGEILFDLLQKRQLNNELIKAKVQEYIDAFIFDDTKAANKVKAKRKQQVESFINNFLIEGASIFSFDKQKKIRTMNQLMPLTRIEKQWLQNVLKHPFAYCFLEKGEIEKLLAYLPADNLFDINDVNLVAQAFDMKGHYEQNNYLQHMITINKAVSNNIYLNITCINQYGKKKTYEEFAPVYIEYSKKDNRFRIRGAYKNGKCETINLERIKHIAKSDKHYNFENASQDVLWDDKNKEKHLVIFFDDSEDIPNRILSEFSCYRKECIRWGDGAYRMILYYNKDDSKEIVIRLLGYGSLITVDEDSGDVLKEMKERLENQLVLSKMVKKNKDNVIEDVESEYEI